MNHQPHLIHTDPIANAPVHMGTTMSNDILMINDDNAPPVTTFAPMKWAKPHPKSNTDSDETRAAATMMSTTMTANERPTAATAMTAAMTAMTKTPVGDFFGCSGHLHAQCKAETAKCATQHPADMDTKPSAPPPPCH